MSVTIHHLPDAGRTDVGLTFASTWDVGTPERQRAAVAAIEASWSGRAWPSSGLESYSVFAGEDGRTLAHYSQWASEEAYQRYFREKRDERNAEIDAAVPGIERIALHRYTHHRSTGAPATALTALPGCVVLTDVVFDVPDVARARAWADAAAEAGGSGAEGPAARHFHVALDGSRVLELALWESAEQHAAAPGGPGGPGARDASDSVSVSVRRYAPALSMSPGA